MEYSDRARELFGSPRFREAMEELALLNVDETEDESLAGHAIALAASVHVDSPVLVLCQGYQALYTFLTPEALDSAEVGLRRLLSDSSFRGAALCLLYSIAHWREAPTDVLMTLAQEAVESEPDWVRPRVLLADTLQAMGEIDRSVAELKAAMERCLTEAQASELSPRERSFEEHFTGRLSSREMFENLINETRKYAFSEGGLWSRLRRQWVRCLDHVRADSAAREM